MLNQKQSNQTKQMKKLNDYYYVKKSEESQ
jgi:hypothetical protein